MRRTTNNKKIEKNVEVKDIKNSKKDISQEIDKDKEFLMKTKFATPEDIDKYISSKWWRLTAKQYMVPLKILKERPDIVICVLYSRSLFGQKDKLTIFLQILLLQKHKKYEALENLYNAFTNEYEFIKKEEKKEYIITAILIWFLMIGCWIWAYYESMIFIIIIFWIYALIWIPCIIRWYKKRKMFRDAYKEITSSMYKSNPEL